MLALINLSFEQGVAVKPVNTKYIYIYNIHHILYCIIRFPRTFLKLY